MMRATTEAEETEADADADAEKEKEEKKRPCCRSRGMVASGGGGGLRSPEAAVLEAGGAAH